MSAREKFAQYFTAGPQTQSANNQTLELEVQLPVVRLPTLNKVTIIELLKVAVYQTTTDVAVAASGNEWHTISTAQVPSATLNNCLVDSVTLWGSLRHHKMTTAVGVETWEDCEYDLTDGDGHGKLVGTDSLFLYSGSTAVAANLSWIWRIWYRFVNVGLLEWIGITQSQS